MKIGLVLASAAGSVKHVMASVLVAVAEDHELVYLHPSSAHVPDEERHRLAGEFVQSCDAIVGILDPAVLTMRQRLGSSVPYFLFLLGTMPRGAFGLRPYVSKLTSADVLIVNSEADRRLCEMFFGNAQVQLVPLAYDDREFHLVNPSELPAIRAELGLPESARVMLYAGRVTPEKNVQAVLRVFAILVRVVPDLHLVLAGRIIAVPFTEFGVSPTAFPETLASISAKLGIPAERVLYAGPVSPAELREFYSLADLAINLTLHHDENFGLAQVEAMACGAPVVGSLWGGLKDTIVDGRTGFRVSAVPTPFGVKVNWWEAANRALEILRDEGARARFREECPRRVANYSQASLRAALGRILRERSAGAAAGSAQPLSVTEFAAEFWAVCDPDADRRAPFRRGERSMELYQELIAPFAGLSSLAVAADEPLRPEQAVCLAVPIAGGHEEGFWPDDPLYPLECRVPAELLAGFEAILAAFRTQPVSTVAGILAADGASREALEWMVQMGLVLRVQEPDGWLEHEHVRAELAQALFSFRRLPASGADFVVSD